MLLIGVHVMAEAAPTSGLPVVINRNNIAFQTRFAVTSECNGVSLSTNNAYIRRPHFFLTISPDIANPERVGWRLDLYENPDDRGPAGFFEFSSVADAVRSVCSIVKAKGGVSEN